MTITSASPVSSVASGQNAPTAAGIPPKTLGQADFLKLLTVQLAQQDPLKPMDDTAFVAQMAQFTSLQQTADMSKQITALTSSHAFQTGAGLIGSLVTIRTDAGDVTGQVQSVDSSSGAVQLNVDGALYPLGQVIGVAPVPASPSPST